MTERSISVIFTILLSLLLARPSVTVAEPVIAAAGDIACASTKATTTTCRQRYTSDLLVSGAFDAILALGDSQYPDGSLPAYNSYYDGTWGRVKAITHPVPGNHDYHTQNATGYYSYFGSAAGDPAKGYYSFDLGAWHIVALNSNCPAVGGCGAGSPEEQWLRADLEAHANGCTLAYWHHPRFSSGTTHGSNPTYGAFWQALYDHGVSVVLNGHEHNYERFGPQTPIGASNPNGIREFVVGTRGGSHYRFGPPIANSIVRDSATFGVLTLTLHATSYDFQFLPEAGSTFTDSGAGVSCVLPGRSRDDFSITAPPTSDVRGNGARRSVDVPPRLGLANPGSLMGEESLLNFSSIHSDVRSSVMTVLTWNVGERW
jgi:hypothetical protein